MEKPKDNRCEPVFTCNHGVLYPCVYFKSKGESLLCNYKTTEYTCVSAVAIINAIVLKLTAEGIKIDERRTEGI